MIAYWLQDYILPVTNKIANNYRAQIRGEPAQMFSSFERHWLSGTDGFYNYDVFDIADQYDVWVFRLSTRS